MSDILYTIGMVTIGLCSAVLIALFIKLAKDSIKKHDSKVLHS